MRNNCLNPYCRDELRKRKSCWGLCRKCWESARWLIQTGRVTVDQLIETNRIELPRPELTEKPLKFGWWRLSKKYKLRREWLMGKEP